MYLDINFFSYKQTSLKAGHSTSLFIVVIAERWSHSQVSILLCCTFDNFFVLQSVTKFVQRFNEIIYFVPFEPETTDRSQPAKFISPARG